MKLIKYINIDFEGERMLVSEKDNKVLLYGDYYHDKIDYQIEAYLQCLSDLGIDYTLEKQEVSAKFMNKLSE